MTHHHDHAQRDRAGIETALAHWARIIGEQHRAAAELQGWRYPNIAALLAAEGRFFSPAPEPLPAERRGAVGECWFNAAVHADDHQSVVYVEGWATMTIGLEEPARLVRPRRRRNRTDRRMECQHVLPRHPAH